MGASRVTFNPSITSRGTVVGADLDDGIRESGIPDKVRMPRRYVKAAQAAHRRVQTRAVDSEAVRHFIEQTDLDYPRDGQVDAHDIAIFARKMSVRPPPEGWEERCELMVQECLQRTGYGNKGMPNTAPPVISAADIVAACRTRTDPCSKEVTARPFRDDWIALVKAANATATRARLMTSGSPDGGRGTDRRGEGRGAREGRSRLHRRGGRCCDECLGGAAGLAGGAEECGDRDDLARRGRPVAERQDREAGARRGRAQYALKPRKVVCADEILRRLGLGFLAM